MSWLIIGLNLLNGKYQTLEPLNAAAVNASIAVAEIVAFEWRDWFDAQNRVVGYHAGSAILSLLTAVMFARECVHWKHGTFRIRRHARAFSENQIQLVIMAIATTGYVMVGALIFAGLERAQKWAIDDAVYFCVVTLTTVGFGDMTLQSSASIVVFSVYAPIGLVILGMTIFTIRQVILEFLTIRLSLQIYKMLSIWTVSHELGMDPTTETGILACIF
jgi:hypothetical protein